MSTSTSAFPNVDLPGRIGDQTPLINQIYMPLQELHSRWSDERITDGIGIFSKLEFAENPVRRILTQGGWDGAYRSEDVTRPYLQTDIVVPNGSQLTVAATHLSLLRSCLTNPRLRRLEASQLDSLIRDRPEHGNIVVSGDFNGGKLSPSVRAISKILDRVDGDIAAPTWRWKIDSRALGQRTLGLVKKRLDYVFVAGVTVLEEDIIKDHPSDHDPLLLRLLVDSPTG